METVGGRRRFSEAERTAIYLAAGGNCAGCGEALESGWHADHLRPYSQGGETTIANGRALCPVCNLKKGSSYVLKLRKWQERAIATWEEAKKSNFLLVATPGSGKTRFALELIRRQLAAGEIDQVAIVVPTEHLKYQWEAKGTELGLKLNPELSNSNLRGLGTHGVSYVGACMTYAQVAKSEDCADLHRLYWSRRRTAVIFDEIHHAGDEKAWGAGIERAFRPAKFRLLLSGTPFREDNCAIPFVEYDEEGKSKADEKYTYAEALQDKMCVDVYFPSIESKGISWMRDNEIFDLEFGDEATNQQSSDRLRSALHKDSEILATMLAKGHECLENTRATMSNAGGLVLAYEQDDAREIVRLIRETTGRNPTIAISDDPQARKAIEAFAVGRGEWLVAVRMVSEGVDIPRLKVLVYATKTKTELFFRQAVGRVVRIGEARNKSQEHQPAHVVLPADPALIELARAIKEERDHVLEQEEYIQNELFDLESSQQGDAATSYAFLHAAGEEGKTYWHGEEFTKDELDMARAAVQETGATCNEYEMARFGRFYRRQPLGEQPQAEQQTNSESTHAKEKALRRGCQGLANRLAKLLDVHVKEIHTQWLAAGGRQHDMSDVRDLERKRAWLEERIREFATS